MLGLQVNTYVLAGDYGEAVSHRRIASKMDIADIADILSPQRVAPIASREAGMSEDDSDDEAGPSSHCEPSGARDEVAPDPTSGLFLLGEQEEEVEEEEEEEEDIPVPVPRPSPFGTPTSRVGLPSTSRPPRASAPEPVPSAQVEPAQEGGCTASSGGEECELPLPPLRGDELMQVLERPRVDQYRADRRMRNKRPYNEYPSGEVLELSDEDEDEARLHKSGAGLPSSSGEKSKQDPITVETIDAQIARRMEEQLERRLREANEMNAARIASLQETMERERMEAQQRHADLMAQNQQFMMAMMARLTALPQVPVAQPAATFPVATPMMPAPRPSSHAVYIPEHVLPAPATTIAEPLPQPAAELQAQPAPASSADLRPRGRNFPAPPPPSSPPQEAHTQTADPAPETQTANDAVFEGDDTARHTEGVDEPRMSPARATEDDEDVHMRGSQESEEMEQDIQAAQSSPPANFTDARPEPEPMATSPDVRVVAVAEPAVDEVINL